MSRHCYYGDAEYYYMEEWLWRQWQWHQQQQEYLHWVATGLWYQQHEYYQRAASDWYHQAEWAQLQQQIEEDTKRRLMKFKAKYERKASRKFEKALKIVKENYLDSELKQCINLAILYFGYGGKKSTSRGAADAIRQTRLAKKFAATGTSGKQKTKTKNEEKTKEGVLFDELHKLLISAEKYARDTLMIRTQQQVPMGDKKKFQAVLDEAFGGNIDDEEENSRLMQSYRIVIWEEFPGAFPSNNKKTNLKQGRKKARRERPAEPQRNLSVPAAGERNKDEEICNISFSCNGKTPVGGPIVEEVIEELEEDYEDDEDDEDEEKEEEDVDEDESDEEDEE